MGYRDPLEAALARIAALETEVRELKSYGMTVEEAELLQLRQDLAIARQNAEADATIHKYDLERIAAESKHEREISQVYHDSELASLQAQLTAAGVRADALQSEVARRDARIAELEAELLRALSTPRDELAAHYARRETELEAELEAIDPMIAKRAPGPEVDEHLAVAMRTALETERQVRRARAETELARVRRALDALGNT